MRFGALRRLFNRLLGDRRGTTSIVMTLMLVPMIGAVGMAVEGGTWYLIHRAAQNAADAAAVAAAVNDCAAGTACNQSPKLSASYVQEAAAVASKFGFVADASTDISTTIVNCPGTTEPNCYRVEITKRFPVSLVRMVGYNGDTTLSGRPAQTIRAASIARKKGLGDMYCITTVGAGASAIDMDGGGGGGLSIDFGGCDFLAIGGGASCTNAVGQGSNIGYSDVLSTGQSNKDCGTERQLNLANVPPDAYASLNGTLDTAIPSAAASCPSGYAKANNQNLITGAAFARNTISSGSQTFTMAAPYCGDVRISGTVTATGTMVILNGRLDLADGATLSGTGLTIILGGGNLAGANGWNHTIVSTGSGTGTLDFQAPKSDGNAWNGVAVYVDPDLTVNVDQNWSGGKPALKISGMIYAPTAIVDVGGAINHATGGDACLAFYTKGLRVNGVVSLFAEPTRECDRAKVSVPRVPGTETRQALVQ